MLRFEEAVRLASGEPATIVDEVLLRDAASGRPLLTGTTLAGALRDMLVRLTGDAELAGTLFGTATGSEMSESLVIVDDSVASESEVEIREGVKLDGSSRTAVDGALYDAEAWAAQVAFPLRLELVLTKHHAAQAERLVQAFATLLDHLREEGLAFGARKRRGFGLARVGFWCVRSFDLTTVDGLLDWLAIRDPGEDDRKLVVTAALGTDLLPDHRQFADLEAQFSIPGSLLIRSGTGEDDRAPDMVHLHAKRTGTTARDAIVSGTSWAGALRAQATRILRLFGSDDAVQRKMDDLFGPDLHKEQGQPTPRGSRLSVRTSIVQGGTRDLVQHRVSIDRFTGGAYPGALFNQQPLFGNGQALLTLRARIQDPSDADVGLLLLLLKDLWTGMLPIGGERSVGRGRLTGRSASLRVQRNAETQVFHLQAGEGEAVRVTDAERQTLEDFVTALPAAFSAPVNA